MASKLDTKLDYLNETKNLITRALESKGVEFTVGDTFREYATKIENLRIAEDQSDATAKADEIMLNKTAYVNNTKVTGTLRPYENLEQVITDNVKYETGFASGGRLSFYITPDENRMIYKGSTCCPCAVDENIAKAISLTPDVIKEGVSILGVEGSLSTGGTSSPNVFMQADEPETKDGIWIKGEYPVENIIADENVFVGEEWNTTK